MANGMESIAHRAKVFWIFLDLALYGFATGVFSFFVTPFSTLWLAVILPLTVIALFLAIFYLPALHRSIKFRLDHDKLLLVGGVLSHRRQVMKREQIIYVSVVKTPIYYLLGTCSLRVEAAGARIVLPWLPRRRANALLYELTQREEML